MAICQMPGRLSDRHRIKVELRRASLNTVCEEARCPNMGECFGQHKTATFLILGDVCTRHCGFCAIQKDSPPRPVDEGEPGRLAQAVRDLALRHAVITSVTRDDLPDGGAGAFAACLGELRALCPEVSVEVLVPDFQGNREALDQVLDARPAVFNHNLETVPSLYPRVRPEADFDRSLSLLRRAASRGTLVVKSGLMVGLGETDDQVLDTLGRLHSAGCQVVTIGQYLRPHRLCLEVHAEVREAQYDLYRKAGQDLGLHVLAGKRVRSSYHAGEVWTDMNVVSK